MKNAIPNCIYQQLFDYKTFNTTVDFLLKHRFGENELDVIKCKKDPDKQLLCIFSSINEIVGKWSHELCISMINTEFIDRENHTTEDVWEVIFDYNKSISLAIPSIDQWFHSDFTEDELRKHTMDTMFFVDYLDFLETNRTFANLSLEKKLKDSKIFNEQNIESTYGYLVEWDFEGKIFMSTASFDFDY